MLPALRRRFFPSDSTLILAGQSNAVQLWPQLVKAYTEGRVDGYAYGGTQIGQWLTGEPWRHQTFDFSPWTRLQPALKQPCRMLIWWQGESDARDPNRPDPCQYGEKLQELFWRIRLALVRPDLPIVVCQILESDADDTQAIRAQIADVVSLDTRLSLVTADDLPRVDDQHLAEAGYAQMAARVLSVVRAETQCAATTGNH